MENQDILKIKEQAIEFRRRFDVLRKAKSSFLSLFRQKLEEKKIEEIRQTLFKNNTE